MQEIGFFDKNRTGELTNRLASDTAVIQNAVTVSKCSIKINLMRLLPYKKYKYLTKSYTILSTSYNIPILNIGEHFYAATLCTANRRFFGCHVHT